MSQKPRWMLDVSTEEITEGDLTRSMLLLAAPLVAQGFVRVAEQVIDLVWLGRLSGDAVAGVGLATIEPLTRMPRGALARRFGIEAMRRLDQALGAEPEPVAPAARLPAFSARLTLAEPIGLIADVTAGLERLLERLCGQLEAHQMGARRLRLTVRRVDGTDGAAGRGAGGAAEIGLARAGRDPMRLRELFAPKLAEIDAGFGIDALRLVALQVEPLKPAQLGQRHRETQAARLSDLVSRLGNRIGFENIVRFLPAESHAPERAVTVAAAAHSEPGRWTPEGGVCAGPVRPITLFLPEPVRCLSDAPPPGADGPLHPSELGAEGTRGNRPPPGFAWRGRRLTTRCAYGPERIAPEWWLDDPGWRSGLRDYWRVETAEGPRLWLFHTPADPTGPAWYAHGCFA